MNRPLRGVIFDFDGTIADTFPICIEAFRQAAEPFVGRLLSDQEIVSTFGPSEEGAAERLTPGHGPECLRAFYEHYERLHAGFREPFEGIRQLLSDLRSSGLKVGLVTAKGSRSLETSLAAIGLTNAFDHIETGCPHGACKPEGISKTLSAFDLDKAEAVYVGDAPSDVKAAREAGVPIVAVTWAGGPRVAELLALEPDYVFHEVAELEAWLGAPRLMALARLGILIGRRGRGSNMIAIAEACSTGSIPAEVAVVVTPALETPAAQAALAMGLHVEVADPELPSYSSDLVHVLQRNGCDYVCLAGFMRLLPHAVLEAFPDRVVNVHPALLPAFGGKGMYGMHVHRAVIESGAKGTGCTIHLVNEHYDEGRVLLQRRCVVQSDDTPESLAERVLKVEHEAYPAALARLIKENGS